MKTLKNNVLIYDCDCPMCNLYSGAFIRTGMLDAEGRMPYNKMTDRVRNILDLDRSRNEIALVDIAQNKVIYGIDSLLVILGNNFPLLKIIFRFKPLYWLMKKVYFFISYNRKVIAPSNELNPAGACTPDYNSSYRWAYVILSSFFIALILNLYFGNISFIKNQPHGFLIEWGMAIGQLALQGFFVYCTKRNRMLDYLGHNATISLIGALLLLPAIWFSGFITASSEFFYIVYFALPVTIMIWQHIRRLKILELPAVLTVTWVLYRVLIVILFVKHVL